MTRDELFGYLQRPSSLTTETLPQLHLLTETYPYCATFIYLYLYNLAQVGDLRYSQELHRLAIFLPDRQRLYQEVELKALPKPNPRPESEPADAFSLIENFLSDAKAQGIDLPQELSWGGAIDRDDYFAGDRAVAPTARPLTQEVKSASSEQESRPPQPLDEENRELDEALFTETLARIYIKQGRYDKALRMIQSISLNYPKKNRFFAQQIRFLERLILNK